MWGDNKFLVCFLRGNNIHQQGVLLVLYKKNVLLVGDRICMFCIQLRHENSGWEVWDYILPCCLQVWPTKGYRNIRSNFCCWRGWLYKSLINQCKWNKRYLWKWHCQEGAWMWWDYQLVCRFLLVNWLYFHRRWILHGKDLLFVVKNVFRCKSRLVSCSLVIGFDE